MSAPIMRWFDASHLEGEMRDVSEAIGNLARELDDLPESAEKSAGLRKLLEAKDCFVRAVIQSRDASEPTEPRYTAGRGLAHSHGKAQHMHEGGAVPHIHVAGEVVEM